MLKLIEQSRARQADTSDPGRTVRPRLDAGAADATTASEVGQLLRRAGAIARVVLSFAEIEKQLKEEKER